MVSGLLLLEVSEELTTSLPRLGGWIRDASARASGRIMRRRSGRPLACINPQSASAARFAYNFL